MKNAAKNKRKPKSKSPWHHSRMKLLRSALRVWELKQKLSA